MINYSVKGIEGSIHCCVLVAVIKRELNTGLHSYLHLNSEILENRNMTEGKDDEKIVETEVKVKLKENTDSQSDVNYFQKNSQNNNNGYEIGSGKPEDNPLLINRDVTSEQIDKINGTRLNSVFVACDKSSVDGTTAEPEKPEQKCRKYLGLILAVAAALQFSVSGLIIKILSYNAFNLGVWRFLVMIFIPIPFLLHAVLVKKKNVFATVWPPNRTTFFLMLQAALTANALLLVFYGMKMLNYADCTVISTSAPVFVTFAAYFCLGEKCGFFSILIALFTLMGVAVIAKPPILTGQQELDENNLYGALAAFGSMILLTCLYVVVRHLRKVHHALISLTFSMWGFIQSLIAALFLDLIVTPAGLSEVLLIIASALLASFAQASLTLALKYEQAGPVSLLRTTEVLFAFICQMLFLGIAPDLFSVIGASVVISGVILTTARKILFDLPEDHRYRKMFCILLI